MYRKFCLNCVYGKSIGKNTFEQKSSLNKAGSERRSGNHSVLSYDYRILVATAQKSLFCLLARVGKRGNDIISKEHSIIIVHTSHVFPIVPCTCIHNVCLFLSALFPVFIYKKSYSPKLLTLPHTHKMFLPTLVFSCNILFSLMLNFISIIVIDCKVPEGRIGVTFICASQALVTQCRHLVIKISEQNWIRVFRLPANVTAMETESYPKAFVALQVQKPTSASTGAKICKESSGCRRILEQQKRNVDLVKSADFLAFIIGKACGVC